MEPIRHIEREEPVDVAARAEELCGAIASQLQRQGDEVVLAGAVRIGARSLSIVTEDGPTAIKRRLSDASSRLRDMNETLGVMLSDERLASIVKTAGEGHPLVVRLGVVRKLTDTVDRALESLALVDETPAMEVDLQRLHQTLADLLACAATPIGAPLVATHVTEAEFRV